MPSPIWLITVDFGSGAVDITEHCSRLERLRTAHKELRPTVNTAAFEVNDLATVNLFLAGANDMPVVITKDAVAWFTGQIRPTYDTAMTSHMEGMRVECVDNSLLLQKTIDSSFAWTNYDVVDNASKSTSIVHQLAVLAGFSLGDLSLTAIAKTISKYVVQRSDDKTYWNEISQILYEYGFDIDVDYAGLIVMHDMHPTSLSTTALADEDTAHMRRTTRKRQRWEMVRVIWYPVVTFVDVLIFSDRTGGDRDNQMNVALANAEYYPPGSGSDTIFSVYRYPDAEILDATNERIIWDKTGAVQLHTETYGSKRADIKFLGGSGGGVLIRYEIRGDVVTRDLTKERREVVFTVASSEHILELKTRFIEAVADAQQLASDLANYYDFAKFEYSFEVVDNSMSISVMDEFNLNSVAQNLVTDIRIVSLREDEWGVRFATAEGISAYSLSSASVEDIHRAPDAAVARNDPTNPLLSTAIQQAYQTPGVRDGGTPSTTVFNDIFDGGRPATPAAEFFRELGNLRPQGTDMTLPGDLYTEGFTIHDPRILIRDINGRIIELSRDVGLKITDGTFQERIIQIGLGQGIKATDNAGEIIHDIPDAPIQASTRYLGHLLYVDGDNVNAIIYDASPTAATWTTVTCLTLDNSNVNGGLFRCHLSIDNLSSTRIQGAVGVFLRPNGSSWGITDADATPHLFHDLNLDTEFIDGLISVNQLVCPISSGNQIQFYFQGTTTFFLRLIIAQVGVYI